MSIFFNLFIITGCEFWCIDEMLTSDNEFLSERYMPNRTISLNC